LPDKFKKYEVELYKLNRVKIKSKTPKRLSNSLIKMVKLYEETNIESKGDYSHPPSTSSPPPSVKEIEIQKYPDKNRQYSSDVQHQQKIRSEKPIPHSEKDMEIIREKLLNIKSSTYPRKDKCNNRQIKSTGDEHRLLSKQQNISKNSMDMEMLPKVDLFASKRSRQHRKLLKTGLVKHKRCHSSTSTHPSSTESIEEISRRGEDSYTDSSFLEGPSMDRLIKKANYLDYSTGEIRKHVNQREGYGKERSILPPGNLNV
jgi:hypothetical protein